MTEQPDPTAPLPAVPDGAGHDDVTGAGQPGEDSPPVSGRQRRRMRVLVASVITGGLVAGGASYAVVASRGAAQDVAGSGGTSYGQDGPGSGHGSPGQGLSPYGGSLTDSDAGPATAQQQTGVVDIYTRLANGSEAAGTGMILSSNGEILTNNHVIEDSTAIQVVVVATGQTYAPSQVRVVGTDAGDDIAVLQLQGASGLSTVTTDTSGDVTVGDEVTGVGNAGGDGGDPSAATGTVVALERAITVGSESDGGRERLDGLIEVNADIISGDSGGPLYNADTQVIGIDTAASSGSADVRGYAIPIEDALTIVDDIEAGNAVDGIQLGYPAYLGVAIDDVAGVPGVVIQGVQTGSAADDLGLTAGDTITSFGGQYVGTPQRLSRLVTAHQVGDQVPLTWTDTTGQTHHSVATLGEGPAV